MWLGVWANRRRFDPVFHAFRARYFEFHPADVRKLCPDHHSEIHAIYDNIIRAFKEKKKKRLEKYSWQEAHQLMDKLEAAFKIWIKKTTPGIPYATYAKHKKNRRRS